MPYMIVIYFLIFTIITALIYAVCPSRQRYIVLLAMSLAFITGISSYAVVFMITTIVTTYFSGVIMDNITNKNDTKGLEKSLRKQIKAKVKKKKQIVVLSYIVINIGILLVLKYFNFFSQLTTDILNKFGHHQSNSIVIKIILPLGLSYYTLQALSYVIDVFRGKYKAQRNILKIGLFISFFPQLHEGPFGRYDSLMPQMEKGDNINSKNLYQGIIMMLWGLFKIFMIANRASIISDTIFKNYEKYGSYVILLASIAFTIQLYAEFSGYIDLARGISKIFNIDLSKNFDLPFISQNVSEFWRRWHISLGAFFRDYVFYPISTSKLLRKITSKLDFKVSNFITVTISLLLVWFLTGLWHGASVKYICYGLYYFMLMILYNLLSPLTEKLLLKLNIKPDNKILILTRIIKTTALVLIGMIMFRAEDMVSFKNIMISIFQNKERFNILTALEVKEIIVFVLSFIILIISAYLKYRKIDVLSKFNELTNTRKYAVCVLIFFVILIFGAYGLDYLPPDPIYGGF